MHVIQKQYGIFITINHCPIELKEAQKNKLQNNYKNDSSRINFIPPQWKIPRYSIDINMTGNITQFSSSSHISLGFKRHFLTTDIGKTQSSYFYRWSISLWNG